MIPTDSKMAAKRTTSATSLSPSPSQTPERVSAAFSVLNKLIKFLLQKGLSAEGIFTATLQEPQITEFKNLLKKLKDESLDTSLELMELTKSAQVVSMLLLEFLKELPEPLLTYQNYDSFIMTEYIKEKSYRAKYCSQLLNSAPPQHIALTTQLLTLLHRLSSKSVKTEVLAPLFAPHFLRPKKICPYMKEDEKPILAVMSSLIDDYDLLFSGDNLIQSSGSAKLRRVSDSPHVTDLSQSQLGGAPSSSKVVEKSLLEAKGHKRSLSSALTNPSALTKVQLNMDDEIAEESAN